MSTHPSGPPSPLGPVRAIGAPSLLPHTSFSGWKKEEKSNSEGKKSSERERRGREEEVEEGRKRWRGREEV
jgi:hypothetical protein